MCKNQTLLGLPKRPFPPCSKVCPICIKAKFIHPPKGKTIDTTSLSCGYLFDILSKENCTVKTIRVDEEGSLARNAEFTTFLLNHHVTLDATGGYSSFLNGKIEHPNQTISQLVRAMILNSGHTPDLWCYCAENVADSVPFSNTHLPYESWYGIKPSIFDLQVWGCVVYIKIPSPKKSEDRVVYGYFMGFTKSRFLIRWLDPNSRQVKHTFAVKFDEHCTPTSPRDHIPPGSFLLSP